MHRQTRRPRFAVAVITLGLGGVAAGCGDAVAPARPSPLEGANTGSGATLVSPDVANIRDAAGGVLTPTDLTNRGWTCFQPPVPNRIVCSHPNQGLPVVGNPPPADRPATYSLFRFDGSGRFVGPVFLIRTDIYNGQTCESTGEPYVYVPIIGYYECLHPGGR